MLHHVFLSYSHKDMQLMQRVKHTFNINEIKTWTDENLVPGTPVWEQAIENAIESAGCLTVILSPNAKESIWVRQEIGYARIQNIPIFPILADGKESTSVPLGLTSAHWTDVRHENEYESQMHKLIVAIANHLGLQIKKWNIQTKETNLSDSEEIQTANSKGVFISYRRSATRYLARAIYIDLVAHGYNVFMDVESLDSGSIDEIILEQISSRTYFLALLSQDSVERFANPKDWFRHEIEQAIDLQRNIVPILIDDFDFRQAEKYLTGKLSSLSYYNALIFSPDYFEASMDKLRSLFLEVP